MTDSQKIDKVSQELVLEEQQGLIAHMEAKREHHLARPWGKDSTLGAREDSEAAVYKNDSKKE